ncbi:mechanosensitive ion channel family protein [Halomicroarcula sp. F28]|uniref:mechanosensitive ion channel family protein n=1 Tax=Haloarcula salinisoli TaxID=2487746 RepID=UPI001C7388DD|nr:mechanosensitive ion channel family protein [Halomicroarcula salinisoli]MBX0287847.1 mechanosensitive ion channel family protein [Halomicroarcula salinisoli]
MQLGGIVAWLAGLPAWQGFGLLVVTSLLLSVAVRELGDRYLKRLTDRIDGDVDEIVFGGVHTALYLTVGLAGAYVGTQVYDISPGIAVPLEAGTLSLVIVVWALTLLRVGRKASTVVTDSRYIDRQMVPILQNVWSAAVAAVAIFLLLVLWNIDVTPLLASAGIAGIIVGLAARDTLANFFGSLSLYLDGTYAVGDYVVLETGERGRVEDISVRSTVIRTRDDILVTVPNSKLSNAAIVNESTPKTKRRIRVPVGVAYGTDIDALEDLLLEIAEGEGLVLERPKPRVRFREFGGSALNFELLCWVNNPAQRARATHELNSAIYKRFQADGIEIPFPQRDVSMSVTDVPGELFGQPSEPPSEPFPTEGAAGEASQPGAEHRSDGGQDGR